MEKTLEKTNTLKEALTIPNIMGYFRIALVPLYLILFFRALDGHAYWPIYVVIVVSGLTDFFDGKIARKFGMVTDIGKMLDPIADKITIGAIIISLAYKYHIVVPMIILYIIKEGYMAFMGMLQLKRGLKIEGAMWYGKVCTFMTYVVLLSLLVFHDMPQSVVTGLVIFDIVLMLFTLFMYFGYHYKLFKKNSAEKTEEKENA